MVKRPATEAGPCVTLFFAMIIIFKILVDMLKIPGGVVIIPGGVVIVPVAILEKLAPMSIAYLLSSKAALPVIDRQNE